MIENKLRLYKRILDCSLDDNLHDCIFSQYRKMGISELIEVTNAMSPAEIAVLLNRHKECLKVRKEKMTMS